MAKIPTVFLEVRADTGQVVKNMGNAEKAFSRLRRTVNKGGSRSMIPKGLGGLGGQLASVAGAMFTLQTAFTAMQSTFNNLRSFQKLSGMLKVATGSVEEAEKRMGSLGRLASTLPLSLEELTGGFIRLKNLGLDPSDRALKSYTETSLAMGKSLTDFIEAVADASVMEFERLKEFGIKAKNQGETIDFIFRGTTTSVENNAKKIEEFLIGLGETAFSGSVAAQMETIDGKLTMLGDAWFKFTTQIAKGKLAEIAGEGIDSATEKLESFVLQAELNELKTTLKEIKDSGDFTLLSTSDIDLLETYRERLSSTTQDVQKLQGIGRGTIDIAGIQKLNNENIKLSDQAISYLKNQKLIADVEAENQKMIGDRNDLLDRQRQGQEVLKNLHIEQAEIQAEGLDRIEVLHEKNRKLVEDRIALAEKLKEGEFDSAKIKELEEDFRDISQTFRDNTEEIDNIKENLNKAAAAGKKFGEDLARGLARSVIQGDNLRDTLKNILTELAVTGITESLSKPFGGFFSNLFKASGGPVTSDRSYIVGERGPELFTPSTAGNITPNHRMGGGGGRTINVVNNFDINGEREELQRLIAGSVSTSVSLAVSKIHDDKARGVT